MKKTNKKTFQQIIKPHWSREVCIYLNRNFCRCTPLTKPQSHNRWYANIHNAQRAKNKNFEKQIQCFRFKSFLNVRKGESPFPPSRLLRLRFNILFYLALELDHQAPPAICNACDKCISFVYLDAVLAHTAPSRSHRILYLYGTFMHICYSLPVLCLLLLKMQTDCAYRRRCIQRKFPHQMEVLLSSRQVYQLLLLDFCSTQSQHSLHPETIGCRNEWKNGIEWTKLIKITSTVIANYMSSNMIILLSIRGTEALNPFSMETSFFIYSLSSIESRCEQVFAFKQCHGSVIVFAGRYIDDTVCLVFAHLLQFRQFSLAFLFWNHFFHARQKSRYHIDLVSFWICSRWPPTEFKKRKINLSIILHQKDPKWHLKLFPSHFSCKAECRFLYLRRNAIATKLAAFHKVIAQSCDDDDSGGGSDDGGDGDERERNCRNEYINSRNTKYLRDKKRNNFRIEFIFSGVENWMPYRVEVDDNKLVAGEHIHSTYSHDAAHDEFISNADFFLVAPSMILFFIAKHNIWITIGECVRGTRDSRRCVRD